MHYFFTLLFVSLLSVNVRADSTEAACLLTATYDNMLSSISWMGPLPQSYDSRDFISDFPPIQNQKIANGEPTECGSCWAFSTTAAVEIGLRLLYPGTQIPTLSAQQLINCAPGACSGGNTCYAMNYLMRTPQTSDSTLPYTGKGKAEMCPADLPGVSKLVRWAKVGSISSGSSIQGIKLAIMHYGSVVAGVLATPQFSRFAGSGVFGQYNPSYCSESTTSSALATTHNVVLVGWETMGNSTIWHVRNSFGTDWGDKGYARMPAGCLGLASQSVSYVVPRLLQ